MAGNARDRLGAIPSTKVPMKTAIVKNAIANGKLMFGLDSNLFSGLGSNTLKRNIAQVDGM